MATTAQIQAALAKAQAAGNAQDVAALQSALTQAQQATAPSGPTREQLSQAFYAAKQASNEDDARQIIGYVQQHGMTIAPPSAAQTNAGMQWVNAQNVADMGAAGRLFTGVGEGASNFYSGLKQHLYDPIADKIDGGNRAEQAQQQVANDRQLSHALNNTTSGKIGNVLGGVMSSAPAALIPGAPEAGLLTRLGLSVATGAGLGFVQPSESASETIGNTVGGGIAGALIPGAAAGAGRLIEGLATPEAKRLIAQGVKPSIGQMLGGAVGRTEQSMTSLPLTGDIIQAARNQGIDTFNRAATNKVMEPIGAQLPEGSSPIARLLTTNRANLQQRVPTGQPSMAYAAGKTSDAFNGALANTQGVFDSQLGRDLASIINNAPASARGELTDAIQNGVLDKFAASNGQIDGQAFNNLRSDLAKAAAKYRQSESSSNRVVGNQLGGVLDSLDSMFARNNGQDALGALQDARTAYRGTMALKDATNAAGRTREGVFTPGEFLGAIKKNDASKGKAAFSRGQAFLQDFGNDAQSALGNTIGNSFTFDRLAHGTVPGWMASPIAAPLAIPNLPGVRSALQLMLAPTTAPAVRSRLAELLGHPMGQYIPALTNGALLGRQAAAPPVAPALPAPAALAGY